jgi:hypothetical protein
MELIKLIQKKSKIKKLLKDVPDGSKKDKLRDELNKLDKAQVSAVAALKKARVTKSYANTYGEDTARTFKVVDEGVKTLTYGYINSLYEAGKITADEKKKIMKKAEDAGKAEAKAVVKKAEALTKQVGTDKKDIADKKEEMEKEIEAKKKAWAEVQKKAKAEGIAL